MLSWARTLRLRPSFVRLYSSVVPTKPVPSSRPAILANEHVAAHVTRDIAAVNSRLQNLQLTASYLSSGQPLLGEPLFFFLLPFFHVGPRFFSLPFYYVKSFPCPFIGLFEFFSCSPVFRFTVALFPLFSVACLYSSAQMLFSFYLLLFPLLLQSPSMRVVVALLESSVADVDPGSGAVLAPGSGIVFFRTDLGFRIPNRYF
jgi:hypothetical protein